MNVRMSHSPTRTEIIIMATRSQNVLGEEAKRTPPRRRRYAAFKYQKSSFGFELMGIEASSMLWDL